MAEDEDEVVRMTPEIIRQQCKKHQGYTTPELNQKLYLHHFGFPAIAHLEPYSSCTVLYLSHNCLTDLSPLASLANLHSLFVSSNFLNSCLTLPPLPTLRQLDISHNMITSLRGIAESSPLLETLLASHNQIETLTSSLDGMTMLTSFDVSYNQVVDYIETVCSLAEVRDSLRTCIFTGNPFLTSTSHYRKRLIHSLRQLRYLDAYPVFPEEREKAEAFMTGGAPAEAEAASRIRAAENDFRRQQFEYFAEVQEVPKQRRLHHGSLTSPTPYFESQLEADVIYIPGRQ